MKTAESTSLHVGHIVEVDVTPTIERVIRIANDALAAGSTKIDAVRQIYPMVAEYPRQAIWYAFIHGANLSSRGAVTYYYVMRREWKGG